LPDPDNRTFTSGPAQFWMQLSGVVNEVTPPANDECDSATVVTTFPFADTVNTRTATNNPADPMLTCNADSMQTDGKTVWYVYTPDATMTVNISTDGSNYDTVIGVFTGECGALKEVGCADVFITDNLVFDVAAGETYFIKIGEFEDGTGGGDLVFSIDEPPPLFQGPANGSIAGGATVTTDDFSTNAQGSEKPSLNLTKPTPTGKQSPIAPTAPVGANFVKDMSVSGNNQKNHDIEPSAPVLEKGFEGIPDFGVSIPPDPHMAAGPAHIMGTINSVFGIWDKDGTLLKLIDADDWFADVHPDGGTFDPQVVYDHFEDRWVLLYIATADTTSTLLLSVSDDADPLGTWCTWSIPGNQNGSTPNPNLNDYPKIGLDDEAIYVTSNQFDLTDGSYLYTKIRIIGKAQLYDGECGAVTFTDIWDLRNPSFLGSPTFTTVPAVTFGSPGVEYFVDVDFVFQTGTFVNLWSLTDPLGTPTLTAEAIPVTAFNSPPDADQRGGSTTLIDVGGRRNRNVVYQDGSVWTAHSVADESGLFTQARYVRIDVNTGTATEDAAFGAENFWYYYPAVHPDGNGNLVMAFTRSGLTEFASARYTGRQTTDAPGLQASALLKAGETNYVKTFGNVRNRWGDYNGIALDPADSSKVWMFVEYASSPENIYGTWFGNTSFDAVSGTKLVHDPDSISFDAVSAGDTTLPHIVTVQNSGEDPLMISDISLASNAVFSLTGLPAFPLTLESFQGIEFGVIFSSATDTAATTDIVITSNDPASPLMIPVSGKTPAKITLSTNEVDVIADTSSMTSFSFTLGNIGGEDLDYEIAFTLPADTLFGHNVSTPANETFAFAVEFDGTNLLVASGGDDITDPNRLLVYDLQGNFIQAFEQGNNSSFIGWRDMAYDGTFLYGLDQENQQIDQFDVVVGAPTGVHIASPRPDIDLRALAYDPASDHFWLSGLGLNLFEIDRSGAVINEYDNPDLLNIRGLGWDDVSPGGPYLWVWADGNEGETTNRAHLFDPSMGTFTGLTFNGLDLGNNISGGATFTSSLPVGPSDAPVFIALHQNVPNFDLAVAYITPPRWLSGASPNSGSIMRNQQQTVDVDVDASNLEDGEYTGEVVLDSNDPAQSRSTIQVNLVVDLTTSVEEPVASGPFEFSLQQNYPNPFNPETRIRYSVAKSGHVSLIIYNLLGQRVRTLVDKVQNANTYEVNWDGKDDKGMPMPSAVYVFQLKSDNQVRTRKMLFVK